MSDEPKYQIIAVISSILTILAFSNLIFNVHITKETEHLSLIWIFLVLTAQSLLVVYGLINNSFGIYVPASILILGVLYVIYIKANYSNTNLIEDELRTKKILTN
jgi:uncharacterized protein with PQ loop repeat